MEEAAVALNQLIVKTARDQNKKLMQFEDVAESKGQMFTIFINIACKYSQCEVTYREILFVFVICSV